MTANRFGLLGILTVLTGIATANDGDDPYLWLEDVTGEKALSWVREQNTVSIGELAETDEFRRLEARLLEILDSDARIPFVSRIGDRYYNFWRDAKNPRGLWRRTTLDEYRKTAPNWEIVLNLDALAEKEGENWVWHGAQVLEPDDRLCLISLSRGGADADVVREFDLQTGQFVEGGFSLPEAKSQTAWRSPDSLFVATDFGPGSLTSSGYPRVVKEWTRGQPLDQASLVYEGQPDDMVVSAYRDLTPGFERDFVSRQMTFYSNELFLRREGKLIKVEKPDDANAGVHREWLLIELRSDWKVDDRTFAAGSLLATNFDKFLEGERVFEVLFEPTDRKSLAGYNTTRDHLILNELDNVKNKLFVLTPDKGSWSRAPLPGVPELGTAQAIAVDDLESNDYFLITSDYLQPSTLSFGTIGQGEPEKLKENPSFFETKGLAVSQHETTSKDGTRIPYFQIGPSDRKLDGTAPTILNGYGGFEVPILPGYDPMTGAAWLEKGGVFVVANIRGGGEFGPRWHQAALKANRPRAYEDFIAVAEDLVRRKVTSPQHLAVEGGSNGGLLVGNMLTMRPDLFGAIVCQVPLLDMQRYHKLLAGASWMGEYGNPDVRDEWTFIQTFSPYHNVREDAKYPRVLFTTSTRDDRVHPGHARKMVAKMKAMGHDVLYYENIEGGHGGAANNKQRAFMEALAFTFLWKQLK